VKPGFLPTGFLGGAKTDIPSTRTPKKPGFCEKPGFCWGQKRDGSKNGEGIGRNYPVSEISKSVVLIKFCYNL
jgi:hypothetical protein